MWPREGLFEAVKGKQKRQEGQKRQKMILPFLPFLPFCKLSASESSRFSGGILTNGKEKRVKCIGRSDLAPSSCGLVVR
jgi:hypothetical protein